MAYETPGTLENTFLHINKVNRSVPYDIPGVGDAAECGATVWDGKGTLQRWVIVSNNPTWNWLPVWNENIGTDLLRSPRRRRSKWNYIWEVRDEVDLWFEHRRESWGYGSQWGNRQISWRLAPPSSLKWKAKLSSKPRTGLWRNSFLTTVTGNLKKGEFVLRHVLRYSLKSHHGKEVIIAKWLSVAVVPGARCFWSPWRDRQCLYSVLLSQIQSGTLV